MLTSAFTESLYIEQIADTTRQRVELMPVKGAKFTPSYCDLTFLVDMYSEKTVEVPVQGVNFPKDKQLRTFPSKVKVKFQIGLSHFNSVTADDFVVVVDYNQLHKNESDKCPLVLMQSPTNIHQIRLNPQEIDYLIEQKLGFQ